MMTEQIFRDVFTKELVEKYHYPKDGIKTDVKGQASYFDLVIQKGSLYTQAFEIKKNRAAHQFMARQMHYLSQDLNGISVGTPIYCVIFDDTGKWELFNADNLKKPVANVEDILNYREATAKFLGIAREQVVAIPKSIQWLCWLFALIVFAQLFVCTLKSYGINIVSNTDFDGLSYEWLVYTGVILGLILVPILLPFMRWIKKIKLGSFELELKEKLQL